MNWYKQAQLNKDSGWKGSFLGFSIPVLALYLGLSVTDLESKIVENPQAVAQQVQQIKSENDFPIKEEFPIQEKEPIQENASQPTNIDLDKIWQIESSKGTDPNMGKSEAGARGHFQFIESTWNESVGLMGVDWDWYNDSMDYKKSKQVSDFYFNKRIPQMLNYYKIPDNLETRIGAYSSGIGTLKNLWEEQGENWIENAPTETKDYITKYRGQ